MKKKLILTYIFLAAIFLVSCGQNIDDTEIVQSEYVDTENLIIRVVNIYDTPQGHWNYTVSACGIDTDCTEVEYVFNHLELPDISMSEGDVILVEVLLERPTPQPMPLVVVSWSIYE